MRIVKHGTITRYLTKVAQAKMSLQSHRNMLFRVLTIFVIFLHLIIVSGCTTIKQTSMFPVELRYPQEGRIVQVILISGEIITFDKDGGGFIETVDEGRLYRAIVGVTVGGNTVEIETDRIQEVRIERREGNVLGTVALITIGIPASLFAIMLVEFTINPPHSCPYLYSFDGKQYTFDGQSYAGAISKGLKRTDYTRLEYLKPVEGAYHLLFRNDPPDETQYTDEIKLLAIDHDPQSLVAFGYDGSLYLVNDLLQPLNVKEQRKGDVTSFFSKQDGAEWQSELPKDSSYKQQPLRDQLTFAFPKPVNSKSGVLCLYGGSAYWGSRMIQHFISMRGNRVYDWYQDLQHKGPALTELFRFIEGQELYHLSVHVLEGGRWEKRAVIRSGSSLADEYRVIPLDLSGVEGDTVWIRINPPRGFWKFDYTAMSYECTRATHLQVLNPLRAEDEGGKDIRSALTEIDDQYHIQETSKETSKLWFSVPPQKSETERSLFLKTTGYYLIHTDTTYNEKTALLQKLFSADTAGVEYALDEYLRLVNTQAASR